MSVTKKPGRPRDGEEREKLTMYNFKGDAATTAALELLDQALPKEVVHGRRSQVIRRAILEAADRLKKGKTR